MVAPAAMGRDDWREVGKLDLALTAPCGAAFNFTPECSVWPRVPETSTPPHEIASPDRSRLPRSGTSMRSGYPQHRQSEYQRVTRRRQSKAAQLGTRLRPWATAGGTFLCTGRTHFQEEYKVQAHSDFRHYLKKAYRRMQMSSGMSECTDRAEDSDPEQPDFLKPSRPSLHRLRRLAQHSTAGSPRPQAPSDDRACGPALRVGRRVVPRPATAEPTCPVNDLGSLVPAGRRSAVRTGYTPPGVHLPKADAVTIPARTHARNAYWQKRVDDVAAAALQLSATSLSLPSEEHRQRSAAEGKGLLGHGVPKDSNAGVGGVPGFVNATAATRNEALKRQRRSRPSLWSKRSLRRLVSTADAQLAATLRADSATETLTQLLAADSDAQPPGR